MFFFNLYLFIEIILTFFTKKINRQRTRIRCKSSSLSQTRNLDGEQCMYSLLLNFGKISALDDHRQCMLYSESRKFIFNIYCGNSQKFAKFCLSNLKFQKCWNKITSLIGSEEISFGFPTFTAMYVPW